MRSLIFLPAMLGFGVLGCAANEPTAAPVSAIVYELRTYTAAPGRLHDVIARFANHTRRLFEKHGMTNLTYWVPMDEKDGAQEKLIYLLGHQSRAAAAASWRAFLDDPEWKAAQASTEANGPIVARVDSVYLVPTDYSPPVSAAPPAAGRVHELRTYQTPPGKLAALDARFRTHTMKLFERHGMTNGPYFHPTDENQGAATTLVYWVMHESREAAAASWAAFRADPAWIAARTASEVDGKLTTEVKSVFLRSLSFAPGP